MNTYTCINCGIIRKLSKNSENKYCSNDCQIEYRWLNITIPKIESENSSCNVKTLKKYLIFKRGNFCEICKLNNIWQDKPLSLQLDHIDGNSDNNNIDNIRLLCPNCHSQTETFSGKSKIKKQTKRNSYLREYKGYSS